MSADVLWEHVASFMIKEETEKEISMKHIAFYLLHAAFLHGICFDPEDGGAILLQYIN
jgi:hypothetical protein